MRRIAAAMSALAVVVLSASLYAQAKPDFSGKWTVDTEKTAAANPNAPAGGGGGRGGGMGGAPMTITMDGTMLKIDRTMGENTMTSTYKLDGSESKNMGMGRGGAAGTEQISKATIDGAKVVIKTTTPAGETTTTWWMDGAWLVSDNGTRKTYYKKA